MPNINGYKLSKLREINGLTQEALGEMLGITRQAVQKWETGKSKPCNKRLTKLSKILGVSVEYLLDKTNDYDANQSADAAKQKAIEQQVDALIAAERQIAEQQADALVERQIEVAATADTNKPKSKISKAWLICLIVITFVIVIIAIPLGCIIFTPNQGGVDTTHTFDFSNPPLLLFIGLVTMMAILVIVTIYVVLKRKNK